MHLPTYQVFTDCGSPSIPQESPAAKVTDQGDTQKGQENRRRRGDGGTAGTVDEGLAGPVREGLDVEPDPQVS